ncbi:MAG: gliding motility-associated C-terminal domain-containing protein [Bacteroidales bacterium]|nr:gliding motility-associated C-terminal domain-containing protein [Bacteroidales bacterium]
MKHFLYSVLFLFFYSTVFATHERAGEISYRHIDGLTYEVSITTYTYIGPGAQVDRDTLEINWGDGSQSAILRVDYDNELPNDTKWNLYVGYHTYSGPGEFLLSFEDPTRNAGVLNIPNSVEIPFYTESLLVINPFQGINNSPRLLNPPIDLGCVNELFVHNPGAFDPDGDSLAYRLVYCKGANGDPVPGYTFPNSENSFSIDAISGTVTWDYPLQQGEYNIAFVVEEYRNSRLIGFVTRDMQIEILSCDNHAPELSSIMETCVVVGDTLEFEVTASDQDFDEITLSSFGGVYTFIDHPAKFGTTNGYSSVTQNFFWDPICNQVQLQPYFVYFKAEDNSEPVSLSAIHTVQITVIGAAPEGLSVESFGDNMVLNWFEYECSLIKGYQIYRRVGEYDYDQDYCESGVPEGSGYVYIGSVNDVGSTTFIDNNSGSGLTHGVKYCYALLAEFRDGSLSKISDYACGSLKKDLPVITHASILNTDKETGEIKVAWSKPTEIDQDQAPGPYKYLIWRGVGQQFALIDSLDNLDDTIFIDENRNTVQVQYQYVIDLYNVSVGNRFYMGSTAVASAPFLSVSSSDNRMLLNWTNDVPWFNNRWVIQRQNPVSLSFDSIGQSTTPSYEDTGLSNGTTYCYKVKSVGSYGTSGFINPIINFSQEKCGVPVDDIAPCSPELEVVTDCDYFENILSWTNPNHNCADDVMKYYVYFSKHPDQEFVLIDSTMSDADTLYIHTNLNSYIGCYQVAASDSVGNISELSNMVCRDYLACPVYKLPNAFSPNGDGRNDLFIPIERASSVTSVNMTIVNRYGGLVFETHDPDVNWNGKVRNSTADCTDGVYYYVSEVFVETIEGPKEFFIKGVIHLLR